MEINEVINSGNLNYIMDIRYLNLQNNTPPELDYIPLFEFSDAGNIIIDEYQNRLFKSLGKRLRSSIVYFLAFYKIGIDGFSNINIYYNDNLLYKYIKYEHGNMSEFKIFANIDCIMMCSYPIVIGFDSYLITCTSRIKKLHIYDVDNIISTQYGDHYILHDVCIVADSIIRSDILISYIRMYSSTNPMTIYMIDGLFPQFTLSPERMEDIRKNKCYVLSDYNHNTIRLLKSEVHDLSLIGKYNTYLITLKLGGILFGYFTHNKNFNNKLLLSI